ncbi:succinate dehydrogenase assembly factor 2 [Aliishimia ponticola]|uniref:FAD assembly factor SdhE n=1 Tax=Aliishimia ponticola TaxID=2499833 RepID=A0A4S4NC15_9RHOB|nr:succinate dehydrogenase assembly factor 2 [Aliishimia ponticola]THH36245.1 succinate dehydrogenase assembly factor 2 [Aliishimia ponticola]
MRSIRRGIKEMDLILTAYSEARLAQLDDVMLDDYEALLNENDQDLYMWVSGQTPTPERFSALVGDIASTLHRN